MPHLPEPPGGGEPRRGRPGRRDLRTPGLAAQLDPDTRDSSRGASLPPGGGLAALVASKGSEASLPADRRRGRRRFFRSLQPDAGPKSVLLVDDDPEVLDMLRKGIEAQGFEPVWTARDGETAIDIAYQNKPDLMVLDYRLPRMDGQSVAKAIRMLSPRTRIVVYSGVLRQTPEWADAFLLKPEVDLLFEYFERER